MEHKRNSSFNKCLIIFLIFVRWFGVFRPNGELFTLMESARWKATNFDICSALMAIEQWGFFRGPHLQWNGASVYNGHLWGPVSLTPTAERLAVELSLPVLTNLGLSRLGFEDSTLRLRGDCFNPLRQRCGKYAKKREGLYSQFRYCNYRLETRFQIFFFFSIKVTIQDSVI